MIEEFLSNYPNIINALIAIGTIGAVLTSLYYSNLSSKPRIKACIFLNKPTIKTKVTTNLMVVDELYISIQLSNIGSMPIYLQYYGCFYWAFIFGKTVLMQNALYPVFNNNELEILPCKSTHIVLSEYKAFLNTIKKMLKEEKYPKFLLKFMKFKIHTYNDIIIDAKLDKMFIKKLLNDLN